MLAPFIDKLLMFIYLTPTSTNKCNDINKLLKKAWELDDHNKKSLKAGEC